MSEQEITPPPALDPVEVAKTMASIAERSQRIVQQFLERQSDPANRYTPADPVAVGRLFGEWAARAMADPSKLAEHQLRLWQDQARLWESAARRMLDAASGDGEAAPAEPVIEPERGDRRFKDGEWEENPVFDYIKQSYLLASRFMRDAVRETDGLDRHTAEKLDFYTRQFTDAMAPTNFLATNPEVLKKTMETGGENLLDGLNHLLGDLERGKGRLRIKMTDLDKFELGRNVAVTPGKVVYQNDLMQLLQYAPSTKTVHKRPLLVVPPWINKFYILDLREKNSFIKWAVDEGHTVFVISWVNPDEELSEKSFEDYMLEGPLTALDAIEQATGESEVKVIGYCLGGTLLASTLAYMAAKDDARVVCATYFVSLVDFTDPGELGVFIDEEQLALVEQAMKSKGYLDGANMAEAFNMLRANDLIWSFVINNYLMGQEPFPFDLLYWNSDSTRMPYAMHSFYLRNMYQKNLLVEPGALTLDGVKIDLRKIETPSYLLSTKEDHIAPWRSTYAGTQLYRGKARFVLAGSGHIAGVINPPAAKKYCYWTGDDLPEDSQAWFDAAEQHAGSWWADWSRWVKPYNGRRVPARAPGGGALDVIEDAPGSYVKARTE